MSGASPMAQKRTEQAKNTFLHRAACVKDFLEYSTQQMLPNAPQKLVASLQDGKILCWAFNSLFPSTPINKIVESGHYQYRSIDNIVRFLDSCKAVGVPSYLLFESVDLYEQKNSVKVINLLYHIFSNWSPSLSSQPQLTVMENDLSVAQMQQLCDDIEREKLAPHLFTTSIDAMTPLPLRSASFLSKDVSMDDVPQPSLDEVTTSPVISRHQSTATTPAKSPKPQYFSVNAMTPKTPFSVQFSSPILPAFSHSKNLHSEPLESSFVEEVLEGNVLNEDSLSFPLLWGPKTSFGIILVIYVMMFYYWIHLFWQRQFLLQDSFFPF